MNTLRVESTLLWLKFGKFLTRNYLRAGTRAEASAELPPRMLQRAFRKQGAAETLCQ